MVAKGVLIEENRAGTYIYRRRKNGIIERARHERTAWEVKIQIRSFLPREIHACILSFHVYACGSRTRGVRT